MYKILSTGDVKMTKKPIVLSSEICRFLIKAIAVS
jgi:hypothetical protein